jgi:hypothetical protein
MLRKSTKGERRRRMRLIDADALTANVLKWLPPDPCGREEKEFPFETDICVSMLMEIEEAPTIEPRPKGRWIDAIVADTLPVIVCDKCNTFFPLAFGASHNFCPNCGTDMREEDV